MTDLLLVETTDRVRTITLNRPEARNALNTPLQRAAGAALAEADADDAVDVVILTGTDPAFCAGLDLKELGGSAENLRGGARRPERVAVHRARGDDEAGDRRDQRPVRHRRVRGRARVRLPRRVGARGVRRHPRAGRPHTGRRDEREPAAVGRAPQGEGDEPHRQLHRRARGAPPRSGEPRRRPRRSPPARARPSPRTSRATTSARCGT